MHYLSDSNNPRTIRPRAECHLSDTPCTYNRQGSCRISTTVPWKPYARIPFLLSRLLVRESNPRIPLECGAHFSTKCKKQHPSTSSTFRFTYSSKDNWPLSLVLSLACGSLLFIVHRLKRQLRRQGSNLRPSGYSRKFRL